MSEPTRSTAFGDLSLADRLRIAREGAERLHPDFAKYVNTALGLSIAWQQVPFQQGGWADWDFTKPEHQAAYDRLLDPDQRFIVCGDQLSYLSGWQEGAVLSAHHAIARMTRPQAQLQARPAVPAARRARRSARNIVGAGEE